MILVGIDVAKDKHDCFIQTVDGKRVGLEATGHYSYNLLGFLLSKELPTFVFNPLQTNQFRKTLSLRKTKTDKVDARTIALMLLTKISFR